ncbi:hypothetical protein CDAR_92841 [Caerostris darwini]|uniref:Uncharacterized protein n=1 Tax=Caerostris darwini TaxID=1538125 RepID=A0AAV4PLD2_9ARAC|nr:hypothetical protein CDAR_92841 [Caerostris darwini]
MQLRKAFVNKRFAVDAFSYDYELRAPGLPEFRLGNAHFRAKCAKWIRIQPTNENVGVSNDESPFRAVINSITILNASRENLL